MALQLTEPHFASLVRLTSIFLNGNGFEKTAKQLQKEASKRGLSLDGEDSNDKAASLETVYSQWQSITDVANLSIPDEEDESSDDEDSSSSEEDSSDDSSSSSEDEENDEVETEKPLAIEAAKVRAASVETSDASEVEAAPRGTKRKQSVSSSSASSSEESSDESSESDDDSSSESDAPATKRVKTKVEEKSKARSAASDSESESSSSESSESEEGDSSSSSESESDSDSDSSSSDDSSDSDDETGKPKAAVADTNSTSSATISDTNIPATVPVAIKRKAPSGEEEVEVVQADQSDIKRMKKNNVPFSRIPADQYVDPRLSSNAFVPYDYANRAHEKLIVTKGKGFTKEKNKGKRGSYRGGKIDFTPKGFKFDD